MKITKNAKVNSSSDINEDNTNKATKQKKSFEEIWAEYTDATPFTTQVWKGEDFLKFMEEVADNA